MNKNAYLLIFILTGLILLFAAVVSLNRQGKQRQTNQPPLKTSPTAGKTGIFCPREEPYPNPQELQEAIRLVQEKLGEHLDSSWFNCINTQYRDLPEGVEGAFVFSQESPVDNLRVFVDTDYKQYDLLLRGLLLSHELTHVYQFLQDRVGGVRRSCVGSEVEAFSAQYVFFTNLSETERQSLIQNTKALSKENEYTPLVEMYVNFKNAQATCGKQNANCIRSTVIQQIRQSVLENPYYQSECSL